MGLFSSYREKAARRKRLEDAADQLWFHISRGANVEVPLHLKADDDFVQAIQILQRRHPEATMRMYQSKGTVLGLHKPGEGLDISKEAFEALRRGGAIGTAGDQSIQQMLAGHEAWLRSQKLDPVAEEARAQAAAAKLNAISVGQAPATPAPVLLDSTGTPLALDSNPTTPVNE